jgi:hypothetical protein
LDKVGCPTPSMGWVGAPTSGFVQFDGHPNDESMTMTRIRHEEMMMRLQIELKKTRKKK